VDQYATLNNGSSVRYPYSRRVSRMLHWLGQPQLYGINLGLLYFDEPDHTAHQAGHLSDDVAARLIELDQQLGQLMTGLKELGLTDRINIVLTADHGMTTGNTVSDAKLPYLRANLASHLPDWMHFNGSRRTPPVYLYADPPYVIVVGGIPPEHPAKFGVHGYANNDTDMWPLWLARGPAFQSGGVEIDQLIESVDLYPLACRLLGIRANPNNGSLDRISAVLSSPDWLLVEPIPTGNNSRQVRSGGIGDPHPAGVPDEGAEVSDIVRGGQLVHPLGVAEVFVPRLVEVRAEGDVMLRGLLSYATEGTETFLFRLGMAERLCLYSVQLFQWSCAAVEQRAVGEAVNALAAPVHTDIQRNVVSARDGGLEAPPDVEGGRAIRAHGLTSAPIAGWTTPEQQVEDDLPRSDVGGKIVLLEGVFPLRGETHVGVFTEEPGADLLDASRAGVEGSVAPAGRRWSGTLNDQRREGGRAGVPGDGHQVSQRELELGFVLEGEDDAFKDEARIVYTGPDFSSSPRRHGRRRRRQEVSSASAVVAAASLIDDPLSAFAVDASNSPAVDTASGQLVCRRARNLDVCLRPCAFDLVRSNMRDMYRRSAWGWSDSAKRRELFHPKAYFLLLLPLPEEAAGVADCGQQQIVGLANFRFDLEDGKPVAPDCRRRGIGQRLLACLRRVATGAGMSGVVATVFKFNGVSLEFFAAAGFEQEQPAAAADPHYAILPTAPSLALTSQLTPTSAAEESLPSFSAAASNCGLARWQCEHQGAFAFLIFILGFASLAAAARTHRLLLGRIGQEVQQLFGLDLFVEFRPRFALLHHQSSCCLVSLGLSARPQSRGRPSELRLGVLASGSAGPSSSADELGGRFSPSFGGFRMKVSSAFSVDSSSKSCTCLPRLYSRNVG
uniref:N-acetyltransferase domain-containing protein n=1 Tax=Macrostomum lignano TaxID=282301 RepID=A0A1I8IWQ8_9PLAT